MLGFFVYMSGGTIFTVYVIYSTKFDRLYIGQTSDISKRLIQHNSGLSKSTKHYVPWKVIYNEELKTRSESMKREKELKSHKGRDFIRANYLKTL